MNCIAKRILSIIQNIDVSIRSLINESEREFNVDISYKTMWRAKEKVLLKVNNHSHDLQLLEHYISELNNQNPGSWRSFEVDDNGRFLRAGISLKSWDESFKYSQNTIFIDGRSVVIVIVIVIIIIKEFCCQLSHWTETMSKLYLVLPFYGNEKWTNWDNNSFNFVKNKIFVSKK